jgi:hypothetical protein
MRSCEGRVFYTGQWLSVAHALPYGHFDREKAVEIFAF